MSTATKLGKVRINPRGAYDAEATYEFLDIVTYNGSSYMAVQDVPTGTPVNNTTYWMVVAAKGNTGEITSASASISGGYGTPTVSVTPGGTSTERTFAFAFENLVGNGVVSIVSEKTGTEGSVDTYTMTITYDSGDTDTVTYTVTNGSVTSVAGKTGDVSLDADDIDFDENHSVADVIAEIEDGTRKAGHADVADNLTPYSEDSGTTQENPFISQGTGTDNNSVIVTTGVIARQLEKQGNTVVKNQRVNKDGMTIENATKVVSGEKITITSTNSVGSGSIYSFNTFGGENMNGHKVLICAKASHDWAILANNTYPQYNTYNTGITNTILTPSTNISTFYPFGVSDTIPSGEVQEFDYLYFYDLTQMFGGDANIPADLLANPSHFSWYYNGSLSYDAGSLQNCNGRYLECGQGRNLWDEEWETGSISTSTGSGITDTNNIRSKNFIIVVPNKSHYKYGCKTNADPYLRIFYYDKDKNFIDYGATYYNTFTTPANCCFIKLCTVGTTYGGTYKNDITISEYYPPEEGGEGYNQHYDYVAPIRIDTGNETLKAFDKKLPSGVIERNTVYVPDLSALKWYEASSNIYYATITGIKQTKNCKIICPWNYERKTTTYSSWGSADLCFGTRDDYERIYVKDTSCADTDALKTKLSGIPLQAEAETPTTEQGTPFSEYAPINDYSYMAWFDTDGNLVSIPQGCKLFYPVDYKGFTDDLVMYTNGDATALAKNESITDTALAERGYLKLTALSGYDATKTQTLKNVEGTFTWVDEQSE